ncbi:hypothetical protein DL762_005962 [Monosporascus cannonballus]|uniref:DUF7721 domain-containing protein n=1 Tax=Monosporascus cannonballus TaxID=155416 RepID=A0ABY0H3C7_9PEZI|nr:hypothetical protein DL762_005962 [Monosporascus cannonballus]
MSMFGLGRDDDDRRGDRRQDYGGNIPHGGAYPAGGGYPSGHDDDDDDDLRGAEEEAARNSGGSGDSGFFSTILSAVKQRKQSLADEDLDEDDAVKQHKRFYDDKDDDDADDRSMGSAAAMQALKMFSSGKSENQSQGALIGLAMAEASKLFDQKSSQGKVSGETSKESAVTKAGEMALKFYLKSQGSNSGGSGGGGSSSGGSDSKMSGLLGLASKFIK